MQSAALSVVQAGPGLGKTSLLRGWAKRLSDEGAAVAWLSLDEHDSEPAGVFSHLIRALEVAGLAMEEALSLIQTGSLPTPRTWVNAILADLAQADRPIFVFLDDYHLIEHGDVHEGLLHLMRYAPQTAKVVIATRNDLPSALRSLRMRTPVFALDADALAFDIGEIRAFLAHEGLGDPGPAALHRLHERTEGWPALLRVLAVWANQSSGDLQRCLERLNGEARPINAFLAETLASLPPSLIEFMQKVSILERLTPAACQAVAGSLDAADQLDALISRRFLLTPGEREEDGYRFHPLLREHLNHRLLAQAPDETAALHRAAATWCASRGRWPEAINHSISAGESIQAAEWLRDQVMWRVKSGDIVTLLHWRRLFPQALIDCDSQAKLAIAWALSVGAQSSEAFPLLDQAEADAADGPTASAVALECDLVRALIFALKDEMVRARPLASRVLEGAGDPWAFNVASNIAALSAWRHGDPASFYATPWMPFSAEEEPRNVAVSIYRLCTRSGFAFDQLQLGLAERYAQEALARCRQHIGERSSHAALAASLLARVRYEQGRTTEAEGLVSSYLTLLDAAGMSDGVHLTYLVLIRSAALRGDLLRCQALLDRAERICTDRGWRRIPILLQAEYLRLHGRTMSPAELHAVRARLDQAVELFVSEGHAGQTDALAIAQLGHAAAANPKEALALLDRAPAANPYLGMCIDLQRAASAWACGRTSTALDAFRSALVLGAPNGYGRTILEVCAPAPILLERLIKSPPCATSTPLTRVLYAALVSSADKDETSSPMGAGAARPLLSPREQRVLELISQGLSNKQAARVLGIADETVKTHLKHVFEKLQVDRRSHAVQRAFLLGLLQKPLPID